METGEPCVIYGNVRNTGLITNLPDDICVEVPCLVDRTGVNPTHVGDVAPQCAALNRTFSNVCDLTVRAVLEGRRDHVAHAAMLDPNTGGEPHARPDRRARRRAARRLPRPAAGVAAPATPPSSSRRRSTPPSTRGPRWSSASTARAARARARSRASSRCCATTSRSSRATTSTARCTESTRAALTPLEAVDLLFDWERLRDEALAPLLRGEEARYRRYDWAAGRLGEDVATVAARGRRGRRGRLRRAAGAARLPRPDRRRRGAARALPRAPAGARRERAEQIERWRAAEDWYLERQDPRRVADLVIDGA